MKKQENEVVIDRLFINGKCYMGVTVKTIMDPGPPIEVTVAGFCGPASVVREFRPGPSSSTMIIDLPEE